MKARHEAAPIEEDTSEQHRMRRIIGRWENSGWQRHDGADNQDHAQDESVIRDIQDMRQQSNEILAADVESDQEVAGLADDGRDRR